jgi:hypothetical protein
MPKRKVHFIHIEREFIHFPIEVAEFDALVDEGYDDIVIVSPKGRYIATVDEWLDYGYIDVNDDDGTEVRVLQRSYMARA